MAYVTGGHMSEESQSEFGKKYLNVNECFKYF